MRSRLSYINSYIGSCGHIFGDDLFQRVLDSRGKREKFVHSWSLIW